MTRRIPFGLLLVLVLLSSAPAQNKRPLELADLFAMKRISSYALSPDGRWIAYTVTTPRLAENSSATDVWLSSTDGKTTRLLTTHPAADRNPAWSPDGKTVAFESTRSGESQIWMIDMAGGEARQCTRLSTGASRPVWSPDGLAIAFTSDVFPQFSERPFAESDSLNSALLKAKEASNVKAELYTRLLYRHWDQWSDGRRQHIFVQPIKGGAPRDLTPGDRDAVPSSDTFSAGIDFAFSPDGREIAYTATPVPVREEAWSTNHDVYTVPVAGGSPRQITTNPAADGYPRYSPDGKFLAYRAQARPGFEADRWQLMVRDRTTGSVRSLTENFDASVGSFVWSPDGTRLYFDADVRAESPIFSVSLKGNDVSVVLEHNSASAIQIAATADLLVFAHVSATRPTEIYRCNLRGGDVAAITGVNDALFATLDIPTPESRSYEGAEGRTIQTWIFKPPAFDPSKKYPLVLLVHGGPQGVWGDSWSYRWNPPLWAAQGYVVMAPNPRGSTGFGQKFVDEISGDWGGKVFVDLMKGLDYVDSFPYVDSVRVAAAGASFGGYMTNWFLGNTGTRFKTLITHCGVYNFESMYGTTDEVWFDEWDHGGAPWENPEAYRKFSPHLYAQNFKTPTLVIHGANDFRIPYAEAMQLFTALQRQGVPSKFLFFPDESHWVLKPANSKLWHETVFAWLKEYLK